MAAEDAGRRAGRVQQDRVCERVGLPATDVSLHDVGGEAGAHEIVAQARKAPGARIEGDHIPAPRGELPRVASRRGSVVENAAALDPDRTAGGDRVGQFVYI